MITFTQIDNIARYAPGVEYIDPATTNALQYVRTTVPLTTGTNFSVLNDGMIQINNNGTHRTTVDIPADNFFWATKNQTISLGDITGFSNNVEWTGVQGIDNGHLFLWNNPTTFDSVPTLRVDRHANVGTGITGNTYKGLWVLTSSGPANAGFEWGITAEMHNTTNVNTQAQNVALNATAIKETPTNTSVITNITSTGSVVTVLFEGGAIIPVQHSVVIAGVTPTSYNGTWLVTASAAGSVSFASTTTGPQTVAGSIVDTSVGHTWASNFNVVDQTTENNPLGVTIGCEIDCNAQYATTDNNKNRVGLQIACGAVPGAHIGRAILIGTNGGATIDRAVEFNGIYQYGLDFTNGTFLNPCVLLAPTQSIAFDATTSGTYTCSLSYANNALTYNTSVGPVFKVSNTGDVLFSGNLLVNNLSKIALDSNNNGVFNRYINWVSGSIQYVTPTGQAMTLDDGGDMYLMGNLSTAGHVITGNLEVNGFSQDSVLTGCSAAGTNQSTAEIIIKMLNEFTNVAPGTGTILPASVVGITITIINYGSNALLVYPNTGAQINRLGINSALSVPVNTVAVFVCTSTTQWYH